MGIDYKKKYLKYKNKYLEAKKIYGGENDEKIEHPELIEEPKKLNELRKTFKEIEITPTYNHLETVAKKNVEENVEENAEFTPYIPPADLKQYEEFRNKWKEVPVPPRSTS